MCRIMYPSQISRYNSKTSPHILEKDSYNYLFRLFCFVREIAPAVTEYCGFFVVLINRAHLTFVCIIYIENTMHFIQFEWATRKILYFDSFSRQLQVATFVDWGSLRDIFFFGKFNGKLHIEHVKLTPDLFIDLYSQFNYFYIKSIF